MALVRYTHGMSDARPHVVIIGGGFGGLYAAKSLRRAPVRLTVIDRRNHHLFQPLLYEVATAALSDADIAEPIRRVLGRQKNARVLLGEVDAIDVDARRVQVDDDTIEYDYLIVAAGVTHSYFGNDEWAARAPGLKTLDDAEEIRRRFLLAFEIAEREDDADAQRRALTFVVIGGGPTGVELAGTMCELARRAIVRDFRSIDTSNTRVVLIEAVDRILGAFPEKLSRRAKADLERLGVEVRLNNPVTNIDERGVWLDDECIETSNVIWAAGVQASPLGRMLGAETDRIGRVKVEHDLSIAGHPEVFVIGDLAHAIDAETGDPVPGLAPAAIQMGRFAADVVARDAQSKASGGSDSASPKRPAFRYRDKGMLATIGRAKAVARIWGIEFGGLIAWLIWALVHIFYLIGFRNRIIVMLRWAWAYIVFERGARLITGAARRSDDADSISGSDA